MIGGLAVRNNLLCVTWSAGTGHVFLYDLEERDRLSSWSIPAGASGYSDAGGVAIDRNFRIFVADAHNHVVRRYNAFGQHLGDLGLAAKDGVERGRDRAGVLDHPHAVAVLHHQVYVTNGEQARRRSVQCFHVDGRVLNGLPARGDNANKWAAPRGIWADTRGLVVADTLRGRVQCFRRDGTFMQEIAVNARDELARPGHLARLEDGTFLIVDHSGMHPRLICLRVDGTQQSLAHLDEHCRDPLAVAVDERGRTYVLDHDGERVVRLTRELGFDCELFHLNEHDADGPGL